MGCGATSMRPHMSESQFRNRDRIWAAASKMADPSSPQGARSPTLLEKHVEKHDHFSPAVPTDDVVNGASLVGGSSWNCPDLPGSLEPEAAEFVESLSPKYGQDAAQPAKESIPCVHGNSETEAAEIIAPLSPKCEQDATLLESTVAAPLTERRALGLADAATAAADSNPAAAAGLAMAAAAVAEAMHADGTYTMEPAVNPLVASGLAATALAAANAGSATAAGLTRAASGAAVAACQVRGHC